MMVYVDNTKRFSDRVDNYIKYRPEYPQPMLDKLVEACKLQASDVVADIGAGTGISTKLFTKLADKIYAVEPNKEMRDAAKNYLGRYNNIIFLDTSAESTGLPKNSIDIIVAGQAFHWFELDTTKTEFQRVLRSREEPNIALFWNSRQLDTSPFMQAYTHLIENYGTDYHQVNEKKNKDYRIKGFFSEYQIFRFTNKQVFDYDGLKGRALSTSYTPNENHPNYERFLNQLQHIYQQHNSNGKVEFLYTTELIVGKI